MLFSGNYGDWDIENNPYLFTKTTKKSVKTKIVSVFFAVAPFRGHLFILLATSTDKVRKSLSD